MGYVLDYAARTGIKGVGVIIAPETGEDVKNYAKNGKAWNINVAYIPQEPLGLAHAVKTAQDFLGEDSFIMCLGDNPIGKGFNTFLKKFETESLDALILLKNGLTLVTDDEQLYRTGKKYVKTITSDEL